MRFIVIAFIAVLSGCSYKADIIRYASEANDTAVSDAEFVICRGASIGAIRRAYGSSERSVVWRKLCLDESEFSPVEQ